MRHLSDDDLVLHYYGEDGRTLVTVERHLRTCARCARAYEALARSLNAVTPPEFTELDEMPPLGQMLRDRLTEPAACDAIPRVTWRDAAIAALVWLVPLLYPVSLQVVFTTSRWAGAHAALIPLLLLALLWSCAGPLLAALALDRTYFPGGAQRASTRLVAVGALLAAVAPALFLFVRAVNVRMPSDAGLWSWYGVIAVGALGALVRWPIPARSARRFVYVHRVSALLLVTFLLGHVINQVLAFVSLPSYAAMRSVMRLASVYPVSDAVILVAVAIQIVTGTIAGMKNVGAGVVGRNLQTASGWYLAAFLLMHVFSGLVLGAPSFATGPAPVAGSFNLLATPRAVAQLPFLLLGVAAFLFHVGVYARLVALAYMAETSVRRLSYAGALVATAVIVSVGLSLCGIHL